MVSTPKKRLQFVHAYNMIAVLNLDMINALVGSVNGTDAGNAWINSCASRFSSRREAVGFRP